jgi:predicted GNAT family acetyltransferase
MASESTVLHRPDRFCFEIQIGAYITVLEYQLVDGIMTIHHTYVPMELRGKGLAGQLAKAAFDFARAEGLQVIPACSYIATYAKRFPEAGALVLTD